MKIIKPSWEIINEPNWSELTKQLEMVARTCYKSHDKITEDSADKLVSNLIKRDHTAMIEFADMTVRFVCDRGVSHELVRHRHCSFAQESTRYVKYDEEMEFILPCWMDDSLIGRHTEKTIYPLEDGTAEYEWFSSCDIAENSYEIMINSGWSPQQARSILPNSLKTEIVMKTNLRDWRHIFHLRCDKAAHPQMRELMLPLHDYLVEKCPVVFGGIEFNRWLIKQKDKQNDKT